MIEPNETPIAPDDDLPREGPREAADDFYCLRYRVWYPSYDCALRTRFRTSAGCLRCDQGRFNLKRHAGALVRVRWPLTAAD
jgi:hypothetical protein